MKKLSVALAAYNEEKNLTACLSSVSEFADEIVVVDGGSTDNTVRVAKGYGAKVYTYDNPPVFHINKQRAVDKCSGKWILQLDADEIVTPQLQSEILQKTKQRTFSGYFVPRKNFFLGHEMKKGGQSPDYVVRLFLRGYGKFPQKSVHEQIVVDGKIGYLKEELLHYPYKTPGEYWEKALRYSNLVALELLREKEPVTIRSGVQFFFFQPVGVFFNLFVRHKGVLDGIFGFLFAFFSALQRPIAYCMYISYKRRGVTHE